MARISFDIIVPVPVALGAAVVPLATVPVTVKVSSTSNKASSTVGKVIGPLVVDPAGMVTCSGVPSV